MGAKNVEREVPAQTLAQRWDGWFRYCSEVTRALSQPGPTTLPLVSLVVANLFPLVGVQLWGWDLTDLLLLYWLENAVVGVFTALGLIVVWPERPQYGMLAVVKLFSVPFFAVHYGIFWIVHGIFLMAFFGGGSGGFFGGSAAPPAGVGAAHWGAAGSFFLAPLQTTLDNAGTLAWPLALMFVSHGVAFVTDFLATGEFRRTQVGEVMMRPYGRVVVLHLSIVFGGFLAMAMGPSQAVLLLFVLFKLAADAMSYLRSRRPEGMIDGQPAALPDAG